MKYKAKISSFGHYVPEKVVTNIDLEKIVDTSDEWIRLRTGMVERRIAAQGENTSDLALNAAINAIEKSTVKYKDIELIIVATISGDHAYPSTACLVQKKLGLRGVPSFDVSAGCTGFIYGVNIAKQFIENGTYKHILVVGVELLSRFLNWDDRNTCVLFGDGAGAAVISRNDKGQISEIIDADIEADGTQDDILVQPAGGSAMPASEETVKNKLHAVHMDGNKVFKLAVKSMYSTCDLLLKRNDLRITDIDWLIAHQANRRIIDSLGKKLKIDPENVIVNIHKYANTSAATIPIAISEAIEAGDIKRGDLLLMVSFGAGLTWGSLLVRY